MPSVPQRAVRHRSRPKIRTLFLVLLALAGLGLATAPAMAQKGGGGTTTTEPAPQPTPEPAPQPAPAPMPTGDLADVIERQRAAVAPILGDTAVAEAAQALAGGEIDAETHGHALVMNRQMDAAAWMFAAAAAAAPNDPLALNNLGLATLERALAAEGGPDAAGINDAIALLEGAHAAAPNEPALAANLGHALLQRGAAGDLDRATALLESAADAMPGDPLTLAHLAEAYAMAGRMDEAGTILGAVRREDPTNPAIMMVGHRYPGAANSGAAANQCSVNYSCATECPPGLTGQVNRVTCEMEQSSAQMSCQAGEPYAPAFDCRAQFRDFGFMIPGFDSGLSFRSPWFSFDAILQGDGSVDWRATGGPSLPGGWGPYVSATGRWDPHSGWSVTRTDRGISINIGPRNSPINDALNSTGRPALQVQGGTDGVTVNSLGGAIWRS